MTRDRLLQFYMLHIEVGR